MGVKSCVCADYQKDSAPPSNKKDRYVIVSSDADSKEYIRTGIFPIGKQGQEFEGSKVVSARCIKLPHMPFLMHKALAAFGSLGVFRKAFLPPLGGQPRRLQTVQT